MSSPAITQPWDAPLARVREVLQERAVSAVPIVRDGALVGIVSTTDLVAAGVWPGASAASDVMSKNVITTTPDEPLETAAARMARERIHRLVVVSGGEVVGILSAHDVLEKLSSRRLTAPLSTIMTWPVEVVEVGDTVEEAIRKLAVASVHGVVVVDGGCPIGVFTHDEALAAQKLPPATLKMPVEEMMSYETICLEMGTPIYRAAAYVAAMDVRRILVVAKRRLVGVVSALDLVEALSREEGEGS